MEEVHCVTALSAEARRDLIGDPHRAVAEGMDLAVGAHARRDGTGQQGCRPATSTPPRRVAP